MVTEQNDNDVNEEEPIINYNDSFDDNDGFDEQAPEPNDSKKVISSYYSN